MHIHIKENRAAAPLWNPQLYGHIEKGAPCAILVDKVHYSPSLTYKSCAEVWHKEWCDVLEVAVGN